MCVIIIKDNDKVINEATLIASATINQDGLGILWLDTYEVEKMPSMEYEKLKTTRPFIAHFRYATVGKVNLNNCHPFSIDENNILFQNGTVPGLGGKVTTDTEHLADILGSTSKLHWRAILEMTDCRYVVANTKKKKYDVYNQKMWHTDDDGILYSKKNVLGFNLMAVYGTLKFKGSNYYHYLMDSELVGSGYTKDEYPLIINGLPYLLSKKGVGHNVDVDVFLVNEQDMAEIDILEGHPKWYKREIIPIELNDGNIVNAWVYFNDSVEDDGNHHKTYESYSYDDYYFEDDDEYGYGIKKSKETCKECLGELVYDEFEHCHYCFDCDDYVYISESKDLGHNDFSWLYEKKF